LLVATFWQTTGGSLLVQTSTRIILKRKWFAKEHVLFCINPALKMLGDALHRLRFLPWFDTK
jgi:hypothetical protein